MVVLETLVPGLDYIVTLAGLEPGDHGSDCPRVATGLRHSSVGDAKSVAATGVPRKDHAGNWVYVDKSKFDLEVVEEGLVVHHLDTGSEVDCIISKLIEK